MTPLTAPGSPVEAERVAELELAAAIARLRLLIKPRVIAITSPAAGTEWTQTVPSGLLWLVQSILGRFGSSAAAGNRVIQLTISDGSSTFFRTTANLNQAASLQAFYAFPRNYGAISPAFGVGGVAVPLPSIPLVGNMKIASLVNGLQVGDQWDTLALYTLEVRPRNPKELEAVAQLLAAGQPGDDYPGLERFLD